MWAVLCGHAPLPERFCVWAAFCGAILLTSMLVGCLWGPPSALPPPCSCFFMVWGAVHGITNNLAGRPLGCGFVPVGRALWSCPATRAVLCVGRFLRGCLADKYVGWLSLWSALPPPSVHAFFSSLCKFLASFSSFFLVINSAGYVD